MIPLVLMFQSSWETAWFPGTEIFSGMVVTAFWWSLAIAIGAIPVVLIVALLGLAWMVCTGG